MATKSPNRETENGDDDNYVKIDLTKSSIQVLSWRQTFD